MKWHRKASTQVSPMPMTTNFMWVTMSVSAVILENRFSCGAFGIFIADEVPWDALEELVRKDSGNRPSFLYNDTFISFWEIVWNLSEDTDEPCLPYVESITVTGGIFTDENGNKDVFMGCINGCSATLTQCEYTCGRYYTCDTVAVANDLLRDDERHEKENN